MEHLTLNPLYAEAFKQQMLKQHWLISHQDAGQNHFVGWGYEICWKRDDSLVVLRYADKQGVASAFLELTPSILPEMLKLLKLLDE